MEKPIDLLINGEKRRVEAEDDTSLLEILRDDLGLTGSKYGCGQAQCGACTVIVDGDAIRSCVAQLGDVAGNHITTIESLAKGDRLHPVQQAFLDEGAMQCGYCTAGMIMTATALLESNANPTDAQILQAMQGNICRCGTYPRIVAAVKRAAKNMKGVK